MTTIPVDLAEFRELTRKCAILDSAKRFIESKSVFADSDVITSLKAIMEIEEDLDIDVEI